MALTSRIALRGPGADLEEEPEDLLGSSLGVIFPDDVTNQHGDSQHSLVYTSPHLPEPIKIAFAEPERESDRRLFSHYLWNSSLLLAEFIEAGTLGLPLDTASCGGGDGDGDSDNGPGSKPPPWDVGNFAIQSQSVLELGAGTALPGIMAALLGARSVVVTDYPSPVVLDTLRHNVTANVRSGFSPSSHVSPLAVEGHAWGDLDSGFATAHKGRFDRIFVCDCLWMPWQHTNLHRSIAWFLRDGEHADDGEAEEEKKRARENARAWVVAGFHTGRSKMAGFFNGEALRSAGLEIERIWERDCNGVERAWVEDRGFEDVSERKRWLVVGVLKRRTGN